MTVLNVRETARRLGIHENTVRAWADKGRLTDIAPNALHGRRFDSDQVELVKAQEDERRRRMKRSDDPAYRPSVIMCPVCRRRTDVQPDYSLQETAYICDLNTCPVSSFVIRWRTLQEDLIDSRHR